MSFERAFNQLIDVEKGYVNHPVDRGGPTKYGVTLATLSKWRGRNVSSEDVRNLTLDEAKRIYKAWYWDAIKGDSIKSYAIAYAIFDQTVNRGQDTAVKRAQKIVGVTADGKVGPITLNALNSFSETTFIANWVSESIDSYGRLIASDPSQEVFRDGWINRIKDLEKYLLSVSTDTLASVLIVATATLFFLIIFSRKKA